MGTPEHRSISQYFVQYAKHTLSSLFRRQPDADKMSLGRASVEKPNKLPTVVASKVVQAGLHSHLPRIELVWKTSWLKCASLLASVKRGTTNTHGIEYLSPWSRFK
jgi:hypothetical protein